MRPTQLGLSLLIVLLAPALTSTAQDDRAQGAPTVVRLRITNAMNQFSDETLVVFSSGVPGMDNQDVPKFIFAHPQAPRLATWGDGTVLLAINAYGPYYTDIMIPVKANIAIPGSHTITVSGLGNIGLSCLRLEDLQTNTITPLTEGMAYTFLADTAENNGAPRMILHASAPLAFDYLDPTCPGANDGAATVEVANGPTAVQWLNEDEDVIQLNSAVPTGPHTITGLEPGSYTVQVASDLGCGMMHTGFELYPPDTLELVANVEPTSCPNSMDGSIHLTVYGGTGPYTFAWSNGDDTLDVIMGAGIYQVLLTDANGCGLLSQNYIVSPGPGPASGISVESNSVMVNERVDFESAADPAHAHSWDFGDGNTSSAVDPSHVFEAPGVYTVTLTVDDGACTSTVTTTITVDVSTGLTAEKDKVFRAWTSGDSFVVEHDLSSKAGPVFVRIMSTSGQLRQEHRIPSGSGRITLPTDQLATGVWLVRVSSGGHLRTFTLPVMR